MITPNDVIDVAQEFAAMDPARIQRFINRARPYINIKVWGIKADYAWELFTAHLIKMSAIKAGAGGPVTREKVGDLETDWAAPVGLKPGNFGTTIYGLLFLQLRSSILVSPIIGG